MTVGVPGKVVVVATDAATTTGSTVSLNSFVMVGLFVEQFPAPSQARTSIVW